MSSSKSSVFKPTGKNDSSMTTQIHNDSRNDTMDDDLKQPTHSEKNEEKPTSSEARPKEGVSHISSGTMQVMFAI